MRKAILLIVIMMFSFIGIANAESLYLKYKTETGHAQHIDNIHYKDGVLLLDSAFEEENKVATKYYALLEYRSIDGEVRKTKLYEDRLIFSIVTDDEYIYGFGKNFQDKKYYFYKFDQNLEEVKTIILDTNEQLDMSILDENHRFIMEDNYLGVYKTKFNQADRLDSIVIYTDEDLSSIKTEKVLETNNFPVARKLEELAVEMREQNKYLQDGISTKDGLFIAYEQDDHKTCDESGEVCRNYTHITLLDDQGKEKWNKELKEYNNIISIGASGNRYVVYAIKNANDSEAAGDLIYLDENGEIITILNNIPLYENMRLKNSILLMGLGFYASCLTAFPHDELSYCGASINYHAIYLLNYDINTKTTAGKGKINVDKNISNPGEPVTFTLEPDEGYALGKVTVTDKNGNVVEFTDYKFTMPNADVTIEAEFVLAEKEEQQKPEQQEETKEEEEKPNPNTSDIFISLILILAILASIITLIEGHKIRNLI